MVDAANRTWTDQGRAVIKAINTDPSEDGRPMTLEPVAASIAGMSWQEPPDTLPMSPGLAIQEVIRQLELPRVDLISWRTSDLAPYGLYGIQANYKNGRARYYVLDRGHDLTVLAIDFWRVPGPPPAADRQPT